MSLMGSDTLSGTPENNNAIAVFEVGSDASPWRNGIYENGAPPTGNGVMWLMSTAYTSNQLATLAFTFFYNFINTGPAVTGATMACGVDNCGYIVLNGVKYPSTNVNLSIGYEGIVTSGSFTVNIPSGLNTLELRVVNMSGIPGNTVWQDQGSTGGPTAAWLAITSGSTVLVKTTNKWRCTQFNYPAKFVSPLSLGDVGENAGLSRSYSLAALAGKVMYDNSGNATTLTSPVSLYTADFKTFVAPFVNAFVFEHDYMLVTYQFTDGQDLDTATRVDSPVVSDYVGYNGIIIENSPQYNNTALNGALTYGGDNIGTGFESVLIDMINVRTNNPSIQSLTVLCKANWWGTRGNNPVNLGLTLWKGGTPVKSGYIWNNNTATSTRNLQTYQKSVTSQGQIEPANGTTIGTITYNLITGNGNIDIS